MVVAVRDLGCSESLLTKHIRANLGAAFSDGGVGRILFRSDYPHTDSFWPESVAGMKKALSAVPTSDQAKVMSPKAVRLLHL